MNTVTINTKYKNEFIDVTNIIKKYVNESDIVSGIVIINIPHTTAGVTINENCDPDVVKDMIYKLNEIVSEDRNFKHSEGNSSAHIKSSLMGFSVTIPFENNKLFLGRWQGIYFCEFDGPRSRKMNVTIWKNF